jgi:hypothetical protein
MRIMGSPLRQGAQVQKYQLSSRGKIQADSSYSLNNSLKSIENRESLKRAILTPLFFQGVRFGRSRNPFHLDEFTDVDTLTVDEIISALKNPQDRKHLSHFNPLYQNRPELQKALSLEPLHFSMPVKPVYVDWGYAASASWNKPLTTAGLFSCTALVLLNPKTRSHFLAHVFPSTSVEEIHQRVSEFLGPTGLNTNSENTSGKNVTGHDDVQVFLVTGLLDDYELGVSQIKQALQRVHPTVNSKLKYLKFDPEKDLLGVTLYQGKMYRCEWDHLTLPSKKLGDYGVKSYLKPLEFPKTLN